MKTLFYTAIPPKKFNIDLSKFKKLETITVDYFPPCSDEKVNVIDFWYNQFLMLSKAKPNTELILSGLNAEVAVNHAAMLKNFKTIKIVDALGQIKDISEWEIALPNTKIILENQ